MGSDNNGGIATVTIKLDAGLSSEEIANFTTASRTGTSRSGANIVTESFAADADYTTVDLNICMQNSATSIPTLIDDVRLDAVSEPSSALLDGLGAFALIRRRQ